MFKSEIMDLKSKIVCNFKIYVGDSKKKNNDEITFSGR